jgi:hypothetical protein
MKQFKLKFTEENLQRHLSYDPIHIITIRDKPKGTTGDMTIINSDIYFVANVFTTRIEYLQVLSNDLWHQEGFSSREEYLSEIQRIYGTDPNKQLYVMDLCRLVGETTPYPPRSLYDIYLSGVFPEKP